MSDSERRLDAVGTAVLLAGGGSRRAGLDKRCLVLDGQTLLQRNLAFLRRIFPEVVISARSPQQVDLGDAAPVRVIPDAWPESSALVGLASALAHCRRPIFALAADTAFPDAVAVARLLAAFPGHDAALPLAAAGPEPLFGVWARACLPAMTTHLAAGRHRLRDLAGQVDAVLVPFPDAACFMNINTQADYEAARALAEQRGRRPATAEGGAAPATGAPPALLAVVGWSGSGKTTLIERLVPELLRLGLVVGTVKHDVHGFEIDRPGKDSWRHRQAGARATVVASPARLALVTDLDGDLPLTAVVRTYLRGCDLVLAEGYKQTAPHRLEVVRGATGQRETICSPQESLALVTDTELIHPNRFALDAAAALAAFVAARLDRLRCY